MTTEQLDLILSTKYLNLTEDLDWDRYRASNLKVPFSEHAGKKESFYCSRKTRKTEIRKLLNMINKM